MRSLDTAVAAALFAIFVVMVAVATRYPREARLVPLVVGVPAMLLAGWQLSREMTRSRSAAVEPARGARVFMTRAEGRSLAWLAFFTLMVLAGGFVVGGPIAVMACQRFWLGESWRTTLFGGALAFIVAHVCFERALGLVLFSGWLAEWIR